MLPGNRQTVVVQARRLLLLGAVALGIATSSAGTAEPLSLAAVKARVGARKEKIESLHLRVRRVTTLSVAPEEVRSWPSGPALPERLGTDEVLVAFKRDNRYRRVLELDYTPPAGQPPSEAGRRTRRYVDATSVWNGSELRRRNRNLRTGKYEYDSVSAERARDCFPPPEYLMNVGLAVADPTAGDEGQRNWQQMGLLPELLERWPYELLQRTETVDGAQCVVLKGKVRCKVPVAKGSEEKTILDTLWLDAKHGLAIRKRERQIDGQLVRVVNRELVEVLPGVWLPRESLTESWAPPEAPEQYRSGPVLVRRMSLLLYVVNKVPDDLFDVTLGRRTDRPTAFEAVPALHWRHVRFTREGESIEEGRALRGVGRRVEIREASALRMLILDTPRWHFVWQPGRNRVMASPSRLGDPATEDWVRERAKTISNAEHRTAVVACEREQLDGKEVDKVTACYPADPQQRGRWPIHGFDPKAQLLVSGMESRTRTFWFDPETHLMVQRECGCEPAKYHVTAEYPPPESLSRERFTFEIPRAARLEVVDPALGRPVYSEGQSAPDPQP
ncbi:MAG: hypothetical protein ACYTG0_35080 [Planctomycetota bacterium]